MDNLYLDTQFFFVPYRLVWEHWQEFMGERKNPDDDPGIYTIPQINVPSGGFPSGTLPDYFGLPIGVDFDTGSTDNRPSSLPFRAYNLIYNEWYRDQNLQDRAVETVDDTVDFYTDYPLRKRGKRHDYFTSCLPWPQKGDAVNIPIGDTAPIVGLGVKTTGAAPAIVTGKQDVK